MTDGFRWIPFCCFVLIVASVVACSGQDRAPPEVPGVDLDRLTTEELNLYRKVLVEELSPCGGRTTLEAEIRSSGCPLAPAAARFLAYRIEQDDTREELAERYVARFGAAPRPTINIENAPLLGEKNAPVTLVVFSDFQCPHCAAAAMKLRSIVEESNGRARLAFRNFPLSREKASMYLAVAGLAAHRQGKFWQLHDALYENRTRLSPEVIEALAAEVGVDVDQFELDLLDPALQAQVREDQEEGIKLGVRGTPTIFINGRRHNESISRLEIAVDEEIIRARMNHGDVTTSEPVAPENEPVDGGADGS